MTIKIVDELREGISKNAYHRKVQIIDECSGFPQIEATIKRNGCVDIWFVNTCVENEAGELIAGEDEGDVDYTHICDLDRFVNAVMALKQCQDDYFRENPGRKSLPLDREFEYFIHNQDRLVNKYEGRFIVIKDEEVIGDYDSTINALMETQRNHKLGTFLIQHCISGEDAYVHVCNEHISDR